MRRRIFFRDARLESFVIFTGFVLSINWGYSIALDRIYSIDPAADTLYTESTGRSRTVDDETSIWIPHFAEHVPSDHDHSGDKIHKANEAVSDASLSKTFSLSGNNRITIHKTLKLPQPK